MPIEWSLLVVLVLGLLIAGIGFALDAIMTGRTPQGTVAWVVALILLPPVSIPFYLIFGSRRFVGYVRSRRRGKLEINDLGMQALHAVEPFALSHDQARAAMLEKFGALPSTRGNHFELLINGECTFDAIHAAIDSAKDYILVQFYIIRDDDQGKRLEKSLLAAAARGVRISVLYDDVGSSKLKRWVKSLSSNGVNVRAFKRSRGPRNRFRINFRNHRKIVIVDGKVGFVGGLNIGDEYLNKNINPAMCPWRDTHLRCFGPIVQAIQLAFCEDWYWATKRIPEAKWIPEPHKSDMSAVTLASGPIDELDIATLALLSLITNARSRIWISTPYFAPDESIGHALQLAAVRGLDVRILYPTQNDNPLVNAAHDTYLDDMLAAGATVYAHAPGFSHQKVLLADNIAVLGSSNLDNRSLRINFEINVMISDTSFAGEVCSMLESDFKSATKRTRADFARKPWYLKLRSRAARLLAPIL